MTEAEWISCDDPTPMLAFLGKRASHRKLRLFAVECCTRFLQLLRNAELRGVVDLIEQYAEGKATIEQLVAAHTYAWDFAQHEWRNSRFAYGDAARVIWAAAGETDYALNTANASRLAAWTLAGVPYQSASSRRVFDPSLRALLNEAQSENAKVECGFLRDIFGPDPGRPIPMDSAWFGPVVLDLAKMIYEKRAFYRLPILADALEDNGCTNLKLMTHCRDFQDHIRGCWVLDMILGRD